MDATFFALMVVYLFMALMFVAALAVVALAGMGILVIILKVLGRRSGSVGPSS